MAGRVTDKVAAIVGMVFLVGILAVILVAIAKIVTGF